MSTQQEADMLQVSGLAEDMATTETTTVQSPPPQQETTENPSGYSSPTTREATLAEAEAVVTTESVQRMERPSVTEEELIVAATAAIVSGGEEDATTVAVPVVQAAVVDTPQVVEATEVTGDTAAVVNATVFSQQQQIAQPVMEEGTTGTISVAEEQQMQMQAGQAAGQGGPQVGATQEEIAAFQTMQEAISQENQLLGASSGGGDLDMTQSSMAPNPFAHNGADPFPANSDVLRMRGLPYTATEEDIRAFYEGYELNDKHPIVIISQGYHRGEGFVQFTSVELCSEAHTKLNRQTIGPRYIELYPSTESAMLLAAEQLQAMGDQKNYIVRLRGLPFQATDVNIYQFLEDVASQIANVQICTSYDGRSTGDAFVEVTTQEALQTALEKNRSMLGPRYIEVFVSNAHERDVLVTSARRSTRGRGNNNTGGGGRGGQQGGGFPAEDNNGGRGGGRSARGRGGGQQNTAGGGAGGAPGAGAGGPYQTVPRPPSQFVVRVRGLPYATTEAQIAEFFSDVRIAAQGVHLVYNAHEKPTGEAFVEVMSDVDVNTALQHNGAALGHRYIEVFRSSGADMGRLSGNEEPGGAPSGGGQSAGAQQVPQLPGMAPVVPPHLAAQAQQGGAAGAAGGFPPGVQQYLAAQSQLAFANQLAAGGGGQQQQQQAQQFQQQQQNPQQQQFAQQALQQHFAQQQQQQQQQQGGQQWNQQQAGQQQPQQFQQQPGQAPGPIGQQQQFQQPQQQQFQQQQQPQQMAAQLQYAQQNQQRAQQGQQQQFQPQQQQQFQPQQGQQFQQQQQQQQQVQPQFTPQQFTQ